MTASNGTWAGENASATNMNATTYGQGTSFPSTFPTSRKFWRTDLNEEFYNINTENSPIWKSIGTPSSIRAPHSTTIGDYTIPTDVFESYYGNDTHSGNTTDIYSGSVTRVAEKVVNTSSALYNKLVTSCKVRLHKSGSPTGTAYLRVWNSAGTQVAEIGSVNVTSLSTTAYTWVNFGGGTPYTLASGDRIGIEYTGGDASNKIILAHSQSNPYDSTNSIFSSYSGSWSDQTTWDACIITFNGLITNLFDNNTGTSSQTYTLANPWIYIDTGSSQNLCALAVYWDASTTETQIIIQTSTNATSWTTVRTITESDLSGGAWNYIRFNIKLARYIRIYGNSGSSVMLKVAEIKYLKKTDSELILASEHGTISTSMTNIPLSG